MTDFENSAYIVVLGMILNVINNFNVDLIMPISKIDENMEKAHMRDSILNQKFLFKSKILRDEVNYKTNNLKETDYLYSSSMNKK
jgi:glutamate--cysteine ligase catalytic subunit